VDCDHAVKVRGIRADTVMAGQCGSVWVLPPWVTVPTGPVDSLTPGQSAEVVDYVWDALGAESRGPSTFFFANKLDQL